MSQTNSSRAGDRRTHPRAVAACALIAVVVTLAAAGGASARRRDYQPPSQPAGLTVTGATSDSIGVGWLPSTDNVGVKGYDVSVDGAKVGSTAATSFTASGLGCGKSYTL